MPRFDPPVFEPRFVVEDYEPVALETHRRGTYDSVESIRWMEGPVDVHWPDFKFWNVDGARRLAKAEDSPGRALGAGLWRFDERWPRRGLRVVG